jgi:hypothetical protein
MSTCHSRKSLDIPAQEACSNVPISKSMCSFPVPMITNCQNITINYTHVFFVINCHAKFETENLQMDIYPGLGVLATGN